MIQLPAVAMLLVAALLACSNIAQAASPLSASSSTTPRLCIMNEARYHHEVVLGLIKTFASEYGKDMLVRSTDVQALRSQLCFFFCALSRTHNVLSGAASRAADTITD